MRRRGNLASGTRPVRAHYSKARMEATMVRIIRAKTQRAIRNVARRGAKTVRSVAGDALGAAAKAAAGVVLDSTLHRPWNVQQGGQRGGRSPAAPGRKARPEEKPALQSGKSNAARASRFVLEVSDLSAPSYDIGDRRPRRVRGKGVVAVAGEAFNDIVILLQTELRLLRAEVAEKLAISAFSALLIAAGALLMMATIVLLLQAAIAALVAYGLSWPIAILLVAACTLLTGAGLIWFGFNNLTLDRLAPSKTIAQLQKDAELTNME